MAREIFSKEYLERLRSPEQLDSVVRVTEPAIWMAIISLCLLLASVLLWSIFGVMSVSVDGVGVILDHAGKVNLYHDASGKIKEVLVKPGDRVREGDVVATLVFPSMVDDIIKARQDVSRSADQNQVGSNVSTFDALVDKWRIMSNVVSAHDGIVEEVKVNEGDFVSAGLTSICSLRHDQRKDDVIVMLYVPAGEGKRVKPDMVVRLSPSSADADESGVLMGVVRSVSLYPVSTEGVQKFLGNPDLVRWILQKVGGAAVEVKIDLVRDPKSESGYLWSSQVGTHPPVTPGTVSFGSIVIERKAPISKVFLRLSQWMSSS
ncbi:MAG: biotin/lipoyl-binding protein [Azoarcus sp.]|jgi:multidrug resistance efflux pump|nr:biotin/lipoyl-binding protein [Azoarcus sp.]